MSIKAELMLYFCANIQLKKTEHSLGGLNSLSLPPTKPLCINISHSAVFLLAEVLYFSIFIVIIIT